MLDNTVINAPRKKRYDNLSHQAVIMIDGS